MRLWEKLIFQLRLLIAFLQTLVREVAHLKGFPSSTKILWILRF